ncbi:MAG: HipA domain-containing protein [Lachnospiraceae bacterium]|nr:HipA domain-containing protein [Lachnospiraceae bacterium]
MANRETNSVDVKIPAKLPFGLRAKSLDFVLFMEWLNKRVDNLARSYMNKVYLARKIGRDLENVLRDSCALSITDQFWVNRSDIDMTWSKLTELKDWNEALNDVALYGNTSNLDWEKVMAGKTSLFTTKGAFSKAILGKSMLKLGGTQEREWVASVIGKALGLPVQDVTIINPSIKKARRKDGTFEKFFTFPITFPFSIDKTHNYDDTLVEINLFTSDRISLVHASELYSDSAFGEAHREGQHHRYFYDRLPNENLKRDFERVLILNWLISNHDMHGENFGCLYCPETFEITGIPPSFDHNSADFDGTIPELDVPDIVGDSIKHHGNIIAKIESGNLENALKDVKSWLTEDQKNGVRSVAAELVRLYNQLTHCPTRT